jgi:hypothetical protein
VNSTEVDSTPATKTSAPEVDPAEDPSPGVATTPSPVEEPEGAPALSAAEDSEVSTVCRQHKQPRARICPPPGQPSSGSCSWPGQQSCSVA